MAKNQKAAPISVGVASPQYGVRTGVGAVTEQFVNALRKRNIRVGMLNAAAPSGYGEQPKPILDANVRASLEAPFFWREHSNPIGIITATRDAYDGAYIIPFRDASHILCPSTWSLDAVQARTSRPASLWRFGIDENLGPAEEPRERGATLRILHFAADNGDFRKGADIALRAFVAAFPDRTDVELVLRSTAPSRFERNDGRARQESGALTPAALADYYRSFDAVIYSSRAEAFASVAIEAMACGVPVIHSGMTGMEDLAEFGLTVGSHPIPALDGSGTWHEPHADAIAERLREIDTDYERVIADARTQSEAVRERFSWDTAVRAFLSLSR